MKDSTISFSGIDIFGVTLIMTHYLFHISIKSSKIVLTGTTTEEAKYELDLTKSPNEIILTVLNPFHSLWIQFTGGLYTICKLQ